MEVATRRPLFGSPTRGKSDETRAQCCCVRERSVGVARLHANSSGRGGRGLALGSDSRCAASWPQSRTRPWGFCPRHGAASTRWGVARLRFAPTDRNEGRLRTLVPVAAEQQTRKGVSSPAWPEPTKHVRVLFARPAATCLIDGLEMAIHPRLAHLEGALLEIVLSPDRR